MWILCEYCVNIEFHFNFIGGVAPPNGAATLHKPMGGGGVAGGGGEGVWREGGVWLFYYVKYINYIVDT